MRALVRDRYGGPEVVRVEEVDGRRSTDDRVLVRVRASSVNAPTGTGCTASRASAADDPRRRCLRPKIALSRHRLRGGGRGGGEGRRGISPPGDEVFGGWTGAYAEYVSALKCSSQKPANVSFEEAATCRARRPDGASGAPRPRQAPAGRAGARQRRVGRRRDDGRPDREGAGRHTSPPCAARATSSRCASSAPTTCSTTRRRTSPARATATTSCSTSPAATRGARSSGSSPPAPARRRGRRPAAGPAAAQGRRRARRRAEGRVKRAVNLLRREVQQAGPPDARRPARERAAEARRSTRRTSLRMRPDGAERDRRRPCPREAGPDDLSRYRPAPWRGSTSARTASAASSASSLTAELVERLGKAAALWCGRRTRLRRTRHARQRARSSRRRSPRGVASAGGKRRPRRRRCRRPRSRCSASISARSSPPPTTRPSTTASSSSTARAAS